MKILLFLVFFSYSACYVDRSAPESETAASSDLSSDSDGSGQSKQMTLEVSEDGVALVYDGKSMLNSFGRDYKIPKQLIRSGCWLDNRNVDSKMKKMLRFSYAALSMLTEVYHGYRDRRGRRIDVPDNISLRDLETYLADIDSGIKELVASYPKCQLREVARNRLIKNFERLEDLLTEDQLNHYGISFDELFARTTIDDSSYTVTNGDLKAHYFRPVAKYFSAKRGFTEPVRKEMVDSVFSTQLTELGSEKMSELTEEKTTKLFSTFHQIITSKKILTDDGVEEIFTKRTVKTFAARYRSEKSAPSELQKKFCCVTVTATPVETRNKETVGFAFTKFVEEDYQSFQETDSANQGAQQMAGMVGRILDIPDAEKRRQLRDDILDNNYWRNNISKLIDLLMNYRKNIDIERGKARDLARILAKALKNVSAGNL